MQEVWGVARARSVGRGSCKKCGAWLLLTLVKVAMAARDLFQSLTAEVLDEKLSEFTLTAIAGRMQEWEAKAGLLGLTEADQEVIVKDNISSYNLQKIALMKKWREKCGDQATLRNFSDIAQRNRWAEFRSGMLDDINEAIEKGTGMYEGSASSLLTLLK